MAGKAATDQVAAAIDRNFTSESLAAADLNAANIVDAIGNGLSSVATQLKYLGGGDNGDHRGAVEFHAIHIAEALENLGRSVSHQDELERVADSLNEIAVAITKVAEAIGGLER